MRNYKQSTYEEIVSDRKFRLYKRLLAVVVVSLMIVISIIK